MKKGAYDPEKHHRRSIRLKGHDYAGGGLYFVTLCTHREFIAAAKGAPFGKTGNAPERKLIEERMRITAEKCPLMEWGASVIMPDHFHALIRIHPGGHLTLGDVLGGFKAAVSRELRRAWKKEGEAGREKKGEAGLAPTMRIWHRNYYEMIVRLAEAEAKIAEYIRMNPWRCVQDLGNGLRGMGNPALWNAEKLGVLCSRNAPRPDRIPKAAAYFSGFHSPMEKEIFAKLLECRRPVVWCPAWGLGATQVSPLRDALENNRALILEMRDTAGNLAAAEARNRFVLEQADQLWLPHVNPGGMLDRLVREMDVQQHTKPS